MLRAVLALIALSVGVVSAYLTVSKLKVDKSLCENDIVVEYYVYDGGRWVKKKVFAHWWMCIDVEGIKSDYSSAAKKAIELQTAGKDSPYYGGEWIDPKRGIVFVVVTDDKVASAYEGKNVVVIRGKYSYRELYEWKDAMFDAMRDDTLLRNYLSMAGPDEAKNKIFIGVTAINDSILSRIKLLAEKLNVPLDTIVVGKTGRFKPDIGKAKNITVSIYEAKLSRSDRVRPMVGGIEIQGSCTLGFIAVRDGVRGFVTAGHCGNLNDAVYQPEFTGDPRTNLVGKVTVDPREARYSDALFVEILFGSSAFKIFNERNPSKHYPVFSEMQAQSRGMYVCKGGITTGETCGWIERVRFKIEGGQNTEPSTIRFLQPTGEVVEIA